ncbi:chorismate-binding protein [Arthrobacter oryzae]|uniref:chorismate-binding protein n=1 Tax=Arthrobacter oryzae TaxID=409290 RepID=UPI0037C0F69B
MESPLPDASLIRCSRAVVLDHQARCVYLLEPGAEGQQWRRNGARRIGRLPSVHRLLRSRLPAVQFSAVASGQSYLQKVAASQNETAPGNPNGVCLRTRIFSNLHESVDPWEFYRRLRRASPAPCASFARLGAVTIASSSPERFLNITAGIHPLVQHRKDPDKV